MPVYLELFHGRTSPEQELSDWGAQGPILGPLQYFHTTYAADLKLATSNGESGELHLVGPDHDLIFYDGIFYGDWSVFASEDMQGDWRRRVQSYERAKSIPAIPAPTNTYKIRWTLRCLKGEKVIYAQLTDEQRRMLSASLSEIQQHVDVSRLRVDKVDTVLVQSTILDASSARKAIAGELGISKLP